MATITQLPSRTFSSMVPDLMVSTQSDVVTVEITINDEPIYNETLYVDGYGKLILSDLSELVKPYAYNSLSSVMNVTAVDGKGESCNTQTQLLYAACDVDISAEDFYEGYFLTLLQGPKVTSFGRYETLAYYGIEEASILAEYTDGTTQSFPAIRDGGNGVYTHIDVSPDHYGVAGKTLSAYTVVAGNRKQKYEIDFRYVDCAPILVFVNSFGVEELLYCTGTHEVDPEYSRKQTRLKGLLKNYHIDETRKFKANTGWLNQWMAQWADDLFRSEEVYVCYFVNGNYNRGKQVVLTDSKSVVSNDDNNMPEFTFSYQYAQKNHNVMQVGKAGRIFDNTFDYTFN